METKLARFLFNYRITPHATTGETPAKLLMGRQLRSHLTLINPNLENRVSSAQDRQKSQHDKTACYRHVEVGDAVLARTYSDENKWGQGTVVQRTGPLSSIVKIGDDLVRRHEDQLRGRTPAPPAPNSETVEPGAESATAAKETLLVCSGDLRRYPTIGVANHQVI